MNTKIVLHFIACIASVGGLFACSSVPASTSTTAQAEPFSLKPEFNQSVTCTSLSINGSPEQNLIITLSSAYIVSDIHSLPSENFEDDISPIIQNGDTLSAVDFGFNEKDTANLLCICQTVTNDSEANVTFHVNSNRLFILDNSTGEMLGDTGIHIEPIYIDAGGKNDMSEVSPGIRPHQFAVSLEAGETCDIAVGYVLTDEALAQPLAYKLNPFGREESATQRLVLGYVE